MEERRFSLDYVISLDSINNLTGPYIEITTTASSYNLKIKKTFIPNIVIINDKVCDFNRSEAYVFSDNTIILVIEKIIYFGR